MSELLSVPLKNAGEVDWISPLKELFTAAKIQGKDFETGMTELNRLRMLIVSGTGKQLERSQVGVEIIARYYDQISALEPKLPVDAFRLVFSWEDAFEKGTLFGGKTKIELPFIIFVGILSSEPLSGDLNPDTLSALAVLILAQAQEIFVTKAIKDKMKDSLVAKLCAQADDMYNDALLKMTKENVRFQWDRNWLNNVAAKQLAFAGLAQFFQSRASLASKRIGEHIARANLCIDTLTKAQNKMGNTSLFSFYVTEATRLAAEAKKDNDFIYHEQIPATSSLSSVDKVPSARLAKSANISQQSQLSSNFTDMFQNLKPISLDSCQLNSPCLPKSSSTPEAKSSEPEIAEEANAAAAENVEPTRNQNEAATGSTNPKVEGEAPSPLRQALDASYYAVNYYVKQYLQGRKQEQANKK
jgi:programmed cell death 6-interacting protein